MKKLFLLILLLPIFSFGATPTSVRTVDKTYYADYLALCKTIVKDTCLMIGTKTIPLKLVTYLNDVTKTNPDGTKIVIKSGNYLSENRILNSSMYNNPARKRTYKNVNKVVKTKPTVNSTKAICWFPIGYMCYYRKNSVADFYNWYWLQILKKPKL